MGLLLSPMPTQPATGVDIVDLQAAFRVESVIRAMRACLDQPLPLSDLAEAAGWSPYHFHRLFRAATGIPPNTFLTTLRLEEAKRLLLTTPASVTDICYAVGYAGLGTFTARFAHLVGATPGRLRQFARSAALPSLERLVGLYPACRGAPDDSPGIVGTLSAPAALPGPIFVGLFPTPISQARPVRGVVLPAPGRYQLPAPPDGRYYLLAASLPWAEDPGVPSLPGARLLVAAGAEPLLVRQGRCRGRADLLLRAPRLTDPPVLSCLPLLLNEQVSRAALSA